MLLLFCASSAWHVRGPFNFFHQGQDISHFRYTAGHINPTNNELENLVFIMGQYKTTGYGFYVGKTINVSALVYLSDKAAYESFKSLSKVSDDMAVIDNSETPESLQIGFVGRDRKSQHHNRVPKYWKRPDGKLG